MCVKPVGPPTCLIWLMGFVRFVLVQNVCWSESLLLSELLYLMETNFSQWLHKHSHCLLQTNTASECSCVWLVCLCACVLTYIPLEWACSECVFLYFQCIHSLVLCYHQLLLGLISILYLIGTFPIWKGAIYVSLTNTKYIHQSKLILKWNLL